MYLKDIQNRPLFLSSPLLVPPLAIFHFPFLFFAINSSVKRHSYRGTSAPFQMAQRNRKREWMRGEGTRKTDEKTPPPFRNALSIYKWQSKFAFLSKSTPAPPMALRPHCLNECMLRHLRWHSWYFQFIQVFYFSFFQVHFFFTIFSSHT